MDYKVAGRMLALERKKQKRTQHDIADALGLSQALIYKIEAGISKNQANYARYADHIGIKQLAVDAVEVPILNTHQQIVDYISAGILPPHFRTQKVEIEGAPNTLYCIPAAIITHEWDCMPYEVPTRPSGRYFIHPGIDANDVARRRDGLALCWHTIMRELVLMRPVRGDYLQYILNERTTPIESEAVHYLGMYIGVIDHLDLSKMITHQPK